MKLTSGMAKQIKAACRSVCGGRRRVEIGERTWNSKPDGSTAGLNFLLWEEGHDLDGTEKLDDLIGMEIEDSDGWLALDCYCYNLPLFGQEPDDFLDCNVYVLIAPHGDVLYASQDDLGHAAAIDAILQEHGHDGYVSVD